MLKYRVKRGNIYWYRRLVKECGEIVFSLRTNNYNLALKRHSFIDHQISYLIFTGAFKVMTNDELNKLMQKYKDIMVAGEINDYSELRDKELSTTIDGIFYGGHTKEALKKTLKRYKELHNQEDIDLIKIETAKILKRSNLEEDFNALTNESDIKKFHWKLFKAEWAILQKALSYQKSFDIDDEKILEPTAIQIIQAPKNSKKKKKKKKKLLLSEMFEKYITEKESVKPLGDKNKRDLEYVFKNLISWFENCPAEKLKRENFLNFRTNCVMYLPQKPNKKIFKDKTTKEIIQIVQKKSFDTLGTGTTNKHMRRVHQVYNWAYEIAGLIKFNPTKDFQIQDETTSKKSQKKVKTPYDEKDLIEILRIPLGFLVNLKAN